MPILRSLLFFCAFLAIACPAAHGQSQPRRAISITVDDLPAGNAYQMSGEELLALTTKLLDTLREQNVPAIGFVNERKLYKTGETDVRIKTLSLWLDDGFELGNHTFGHASLNRVPLQVWKEEVIRGETVTKLLMYEHQKKLRYFRHPYLDVGRDLQTRREAEAFLVSRGYSIAPVTMDAWDWMFGGVYDDAHKRGDKVLEDRLVVEYLDYTTKIFDYYEGLSRNLFGYEPPQVLLLHSNWLEADHIGALIDLLRKRGYAFVPLDEALSDGAYSSPDEFVGAEGSGWLEHWAITRGQPPRDTPVFPQWVIDKANALPKLPPEPAIFF